MSWQAGLYVAAVLIPLTAFVIQLIGTRLLGRINALLATGAIGLSFLLSALGFFQYFFVEAEGVLRPAEHHAAAAATAEPGNAAEHAAGAESHHKGPLVWRASYDWSCSAPRRSTRRPARPRGPPWLSPWPSTSTT